MEQRIEPPDTEGNMAHLQKHGAGTTGNGGVLDYDAVVVGAGFAGLYMLYRLRDLGLTARVYEAGGGVGGTWYWNRYPGARCDSESYYYSYSFSDELQQEWEWTERYPGQPEIERYLNHVADRFDLRADIQLNTKVTLARFDEMTGCWQIGTDHGDRVSARFFITAVGCLSATNVPDFPGLENFTGEWYHTSRWPQEGVDLSGKRVGVIGTGSSGIQAVPVIAEQAAALTVFQRTPNYATPARNAPMDMQLEREIKANYRAIREKTRHSLGGFPFDLSERSAFDVSAEERERIYEALWDEGGMKFAFGGFKDLFVDAEANSTAADFIRSKIRRSVTDPAVADILTRMDYPYATKRPCIDTNYFETFNRDNVEVVDVRQSPIEGITSTGIRTKDADYDLDVIVFATGFDAMTGALFDIDIRGLDDMPLKKKWADGPRLYLGLATAGFPNMFIITGPLSPSVFANMPVCIEQHVDWIADCLQYMRDRGVGVVEPSTEAEDYWVEHANRLADRTLLGSAKSWWTGANISGKPRVVYPYVAGMGVYRKKCDDVAARGYEGFELRP